MRFGKTRAAGIGQIAERHHFEGVAVGTYLAIDLKTALELRLIIAAEKAVERPFLARRFWLFMRCRSAPGILGGETRAARSRISRQEEGAKHPSGTAAELVSVPHSFFPFGHDTAPMVIAQVRVFAFEWCPPRRLCQTCPRLNRKWSRAGALVAHSARATAGSQKSGGNNRR